MNIGGFQPVSLIDYPDKICSIIFTAGCNFRCPFCYNESLVLEEQFRKSLDWVYIKKTLLRRKGLIDAVTITGGEPTIYDDLIDCVKELSTLGFLVKLDTQGSLPERVEKVYKLVDYIAMDIKSSLDKYYLFGKVNRNDILRSIELVSSVPHEFRTTCVPEIVDENDIRKIAEILPKDSPYYLQNFVADAGTLDKRFRSIKPYSKKEMKKFQGIAREYLNKVYIRNDE